jgi:hypothetical protein
MDDENSAALEAYLANQTLEEAAAYAQRGRQFAMLENDDLEGRWAAAFRLWAECRIDRHSIDSQEMDDLAAEIALRGKQVPLNLVRREFEALRKAQRQHMREMSAEALSNFDRQLGEDVTAFLESAKLKKPN